ncbi:mRNA cap guanine-N7 methyltransferase 1 [Chlorella vulgaris]
MDQKALEYTRNHYDRHSNQFASTEEALKARATGPGAPLKKFHNDIKRQLINRFANGAESLLDFACGRGGDIWKWIDAGITVVKGIDLSPGEIEEARKRFAEARTKRPGTELRYEFVDSPKLGTEEWLEPAQYDVVTCMFAIHYFFVAEKALKQFLHNVSINLKDGGYFVGTVPDGRRINECIKSGRTYKRPMLTIEAHWVGGPGPFNSPYVCAIGDTVTGGDKGTVGSFEYLVYSSVLVSLAAVYGLKPVLDYGDPNLAGFFDEADATKPLKHFKPHFPHSDRSLERASSLFAAFVFQKTNGTPTAPGAGTRLQQLPQQGVLGKHGREDEVSAAASAAQRPLQRRRPGLLNARSQQGQQQQQAQQQQLAPQEQQAQQQDEQQQQLAPQAEEQQGQQGEHHNDLPDGKTQAAQLEDAVPGSGEQAQQAAAGSGEEQQQQEHDASAAGGVVERSR